MQELSNEIKKCKSIYRQYNYKFTAIVRFTLHCYSAVVSLDDGFCYSWVAKKLLVGNHITKIFMNM